MNTDRLVERANGGLHEMVATKVDALAISKGAKILDVGCGTGAFLSRLASFGYANLSGIDISTPDRPVDGVEFLAFDLDFGGIPYPDGSVEVITSIEVLEHIENMGSLLGEISRVLAPGGIFIITTPNVHSLEARLRFFLTGKLKQFDKLSDPTHIYPVFVFPFKRLLARHSLEINEDWGHPINGSSPTSRLLLRLATKALRLLGLKAEVTADHLCLLIKKINQDELNVKSKRDLVAAHY